MAKKGRPTLLNKQLKEIAVRMAREPDMTLARLAQRLHISRASLFLYLQKDSDFSDAVRGAMDMADELVEIAFFRRAVGYSHIEEKVFCTPGGRIMKSKVMKHYPPSEVAGKFWLENRRPERWGKAAASDSEEAIPIVIQSDEVDL
jgi:AcrR family transcriptional regulator